MPRVRIAVAVAEKAWSAAGSSEESDIDAKNGALDILEQWIDPRDTDTHIHWVEADVPDHASVTVEGTVTGGESDDVRDV